jgi:hypothetical protein
MNFILQRVMNLHKAEPDINIGSSFSKLVEFLDSVLYRMVEVFLMSTQLSIAGPKVSNTTSTKFPQRPKELQHIFL